MKDVSILYIRAVIKDSMKKSEYFANYLVKPSQTFDAKDKAHKIANDLCQGIEAVIQTQCFLELYPKNITTEALKQTLEVYELLKEKTQELVKPERFSIILGYVNFINLTTGKALTEVEKVIDLCQKELETRGE